MFYSNLSFVEIPFMLPYFASPTTLVIPRVQFNVMLYVIIAINKVGMEISSQEIDRKGFPFSLMRSIMYFEPSTVSNEHRLLFDSKRKWKFTKYRSNKLVGTPIIEQKK